VAGLKLLIRSMLFGVTHDAFRPDDSCPKCQNGTLYRLKKWRMNIRLVGQHAAGRGSRMLGAIPPFDRNGS